MYQSVSGGVFGGYNPTGWVNYGEYRGSIAAFLFGTLLICTCLYDYSYIIVYTDIVYIYTNRC
jgi:hypothetical protein